MVQYHQFEHSRYQMKGEILVFPMVQFIATKIEMHQFYMQIESVYNMERNIIHNMVFICQCQCWLSFFIRTSKRRKGNGKEKERKHDESRKNSIFVLLLAFISMLSALFCFVYPCTKHFVVYTLMYVHGL